MTRLWMISSQYSPEKKQGYGDLDDEDNVDLPGIPTSAPYLNELQDAGAKKKKKRFGMWEAR